MAGLEVLGIVIWLPVQEENEGGLWTHELYLCPKGLPGFGLSKTGLMVPELSVYWGEKGFGRNKFVGRNQVIGFRLAKLEMPSRHPRGAVRYAVWYSSAEFSFWLYI